MIRIVDPQLAVERVEGHPGDRRLVVVYELDVSPDEPRIGALLDEEVVVTARDEHDAPILPIPVEFRMESHDVVAAAGSTPRRLERRVHRVELDVEQDWWDTDLAGGTLPIAEFADHLVASIAVRAGDSVLASSESAVVTGSWGALGSD